MGFEGLLGNEQLKENLSAACEKGHASHFYLISGPKGSGKHTLAGILAQALLCTGGKKPCGTCSACRKVLAGSHPDVITVDDPEKKTVPVDLIRSARSDIYVRPNEAQRKIYIFPRGQDLGIPGQNALLKILEEPPSYGVFLLLTDNPEKLLPTVRSRAVHLRLTSLSRQILKEALLRRYPQGDRQTVENALARSGGYLGQALELMEAGGALSQQSQEFLASFGASDSLGLLRVLAPMEKWKREGLVQELEQWVRFLHSALMSRSGVPPVNREVGQLAAVCSGRRLSQAIETLKAAIQYAQGNVSVAAICGWLLWALR